MGDRGMCCHFKGDHGGDQDLSFMDAARFEIRRKKGASHVDIWGRSITGIGNTNKINLHWELTRGQREMKVRWSGTFWSDAPTWNALWRSQKLRKKDEKPGSVKNWQVGVGKRVFQKNVAAFRSLKILATLGCGWYIKTLQRNRIVGNLHYRVTHFRNWLTGLWRLKCSNICHLQGGDHLYSQWWNSIRVWKAGNGEAYSPSPSPKAREPGVQGEKMDVWDRAEGKFTLPLLLCST